MNPMRLYREWRLRRAIRRYADWFFLEGPIQRYLREKHGAKIDAELRSPMNVPKQYAEKKERKGPIYDLMRAYSQLTFGNRFPRVVAGEGAKRWVHQYVISHSTHPHREDWYDHSVIESGDVPEDTFKFFLDADVKEGLMNSYRERQNQMFAEPTPPPNLEPITVRVPISEIVPNGESHEG